MTSSLCRKLDMENHCYMTRGHFLNIHLSVYSYTNLQLTQPTTTKSWRKKKSEGPKLMYKNVIHM